MPELPEAETVRRGLQPLSGLRINRVEVLHPRGIHEHIAGQHDFRGRLIGRTILHVSRRGKFIWMPTDDEQALVMHLGMSGQARLRKHGSELHPHVRVLLGFAKSDVELHFTDQRMFGGLLVDELVRTESGERIPVRAAHIARDLMDPKFDLNAAVDAIIRRTAGIKSVLLNQEVVSGFGNIYVDEALWAAAVHYAKPANRLSRAKIAQLLQAGQEVMGRALAAGGTSFDSQYVNAAGEAGWFQVELHAYGREGEPCARCGRPIRREPWGGRSSFRCSRCQPAPRG